MTRRGFATSIAAVIVGVVPLFGCGNARVKAAAEKAVVVIRDQLQRGEFARIYADAHPDFKKETAEKDFLLTIDDVHRKLGNAVSTEDAGWKVAVYDGKTEVQLDYQTKFTGGEAFERFNFRMDGANAMLLGYVVTPQALITK